MKMESLQQRREELERKEYSLKEHLLKFDHFLKVSYIVIQWLIANSSLIEVTLQCRCDLKQQHNWRCVH